MQITGIILSGQPLTIATSVTFWEVAIDFGYGVKRLVEVTDIMNEEAESERPAINLIREPVLDLVVVDIVGRD